MPRHTSTLAIVLLLTLIGNCAVAFGAETCQNQPGGITVCTAGILSNKFTHVAADQEMSQWCWAASIEMVFRYHGHAVSQKHIVKETYGSVTNMPAISGSVMSSALNRQWTDESGKHFRSSASVFDIQSGSFGVSNTDIVRALQNNQPLIVGALGHAMVVTAVQYVKGPASSVGQVLGATVRDPWPGKGKRQLTMAELAPMYVAKVNVSGASDSSKKPGPSKPTPVAGNSGCQSDADCHAGRKCRDGRCKDVSAECVKDSDCGDDQICDDDSHCVDYQGEPDDDEPSGPDDSDDVAHWCCTPMGKFGPYTPNDVKVGQSCQWPTPMGMAYGVACN